MSDCRFGVSPVNYPDPDPDPASNVLFFSVYSVFRCTQNLTHLDLFFYDSSVHRYASELLMCSAHASQVKIHRPIWRRPSRRISFQYLLLYCLLAFHIMQVKCLFQHR